jgi:hypothetical protein
MRQKIGYLRWVNVREITCRPDHKTLTSATKSSLTVVSASELTRACGLMPHTYTLFSGRVSWWMNYRSSHFEEGGNLTDVG